MRIVSMALITALGLSVTACGSTTANRSVYSERQPVVSKTNYVLDLSAGNGGLSTAEQNRLSGWFDALDLGYGDRVAIDDPGYSASAVARNAVEAIVARYGLLVSEKAPVTEGYVPAGLWLRYQDAPISAIAATLIFRPVPAKITVAEPTAPWRQ